MNKPKIKSTIVDNAPDLLEPYLDKVSTSLLKDMFDVVMPELAKDLPVLRYVKTAGDAYSAYRSQILQRRMRAFLHTLVDEEMNIDEFKDLEESEQQMIVDILVTELDSQTDDRQAEALGLLFVAYIQKDIDRLMFHGLAHELKYINPLAFYFSVDSIGSEEKKYGTVISGPVHYLPQAFYSDKSEVMISSTDIILTNLGKIFFEYIYEPMNLKYQI